MVMGNVLIAIVFIAAVVGFLLWAESRIEKMINDERVRICADIVAHADEFELEEIAITPEHIRDIARDIERGDLS